MAKRKERLKAIELRKQGWSTPRIARELGVRLATAILWCQEVALTPEQLINIKTEAQIKEAERKKKKKKDRIEQHHNKGSDRIIINDQTLLLVGAALYWAEGCKTGSSVRIANTDPRIIRIFLKWLKECFKVEVQRFRYQLHIHEGLDEDSIKEYWKNELKGLVDIKPNQWYKTQTKKSSIGHRKHILYKGTFYAGISDINLRYQIEGMVQGLHEKIMAP